jgi:CyaY protein
MTTPSIPEPAASASLSDIEYRRITSAILAGLEATVDRWLEADVIDIDGHRTGGLLELSFPGGSKLIINTQPPLQELWLAARAGGFHFRCVDGRWCDTRTGDDFFAVISAQASAQGGCALSFEAPADLA